MQKKPTFPKAQNEGNLLCRKPVMEMTLKTAKFAIIMMLALAVPHTLSTFQMRVFAGTLRSQTTWLLLPRLSRVVVVKPLQVDVRWIELLSLAKTLGRGFCSTRAVDNRPLVVPPLAI